MSYETYKILHLLSLVFFVASCVDLLFGRPQKYTKILNGVAALMILVSGMGLIIRIGYAHNEPWPGWIHFKMAFWFLATVTAAVGAKRFLEYRWRVASVFFVLVASAVIMAVLRPEY